MPSTPNSTTALCRKSLFFLLLVPTCTPLTIPHPGLGAECVRRTTSGALPRLSRGTSAAPLSMASWDGCSEKRNRERNDDDNNSSNNNSDEHIDQSLQTLTKQEIEEIIVDLSKIQQDDLRRTQLSNFLQQNLVSSDDFAAVFDSTLIEVGQQVQMQAKANYAENSTEAEQNQQLWPLVDMMVQSKTIIKKFTNELGNKGTFQ